MGFLRGGGEFSEPESGTKGPSDLGIMSVSLPQSTDGGYR